MATTPEQLNSWAGRESGEPVHVVSSGEDLTAEFKRDLALLRRREKALINLILTFYPPPWVPRSVPVPPETATISLTGSMRRRPSQDRSELS